MAGGGRASEQLKLVRQVTLAVTAAVALGSIIVLFLTVDSDESRLRLILELAGTALFSAAVTALVFSSLATREMTYNIDSVLERTLKNVFVPVRHALQEEALANYRWDCHISPPPSNDPYPDYVVQWFRLGYSRADLPSEIRIVCIASMTDEVLSGFVADERYLMRWQVDDSVDAADPNIFKVLGVTVDGSALKSRMVASERSGVKFAEYRFKPGTAALGPGLHRIEFAIMARKYSGSDSRVPFKVLLFRTVTDAEFRCCVEDGVGARRLSVVTNVAGLGPKGEEYCGPLFDDPLGPPAAVVRFGYPLQAGSSVTFTVERT